jgi:hypothetical protein
MAKGPVPLVDLRHFDLNLLVAFYILISERSVTAAVRRMSSGQLAEDGRKRLSTIRDNGPSRVRLLPDWGSEGNAITPFSTGGVELS